MPARRKVHLTPHPGSSSKEIQDEPSWHPGHNHRTGYRNKDPRHPGFTHDGDYWENEEAKKFAGEEMRKYWELRGGGDVAICSISKILQGK